MRSKILPALGALLSLVVAGMAAAAPIPVIIDTDIGTDIDDSWALALALASPELDVRLVVTDSGDTAARARLTAKFLEACGRTEVAIGIGTRGSRSLPIHQAEWFEGYELENYPGVVFDDGVQAMIDLVMKSDEAMTLVALGPVPNIKEALRRQPLIAQRLRVVAMSGSIDVGYDGRPQAASEHNVQAAPDAARAMYDAPWELLIVPLDTAGQVQLEGELYQRLLASDRASVRALLDNYRIWAPRADWATYDPAIESSVLFDALAVALVFAPEMVEIEELRLQVGNDGFTRRSASGSPVRAALKWRQPRHTFETLIVERLTAE